MSKFIVVGKGGREYAMAWLLSQKHQVYSLGASDAIRRFAPPLEEKKQISLENTLPEWILPKLCEFSDAVFLVGPEQPLASGWVDQVQSYLPQAKILGPNQQASKLESSKVWSKYFLLRSNVPTADFEVISKLEEFSTAIRKFSPPYVIKADGLAGGKGVGIFSEKEEAYQFAKKILTTTELGTHQQCLIERYLNGKELSLFLLLDGQRAVQIGIAQDYKRLLDGNRGPNTGGMGAYCPTNLTPEEEKSLQHYVIHPILHALRQENLFYKGFLYLGLMQTQKGFFVLELNVRMGDPETQVVFPLLGNDLPRLLEKASEGNLNALEGINYQPLKNCFGKCPQPKQFAVCVVLATPDYPKKQKKSYPLACLEQLEFELQNQKDSYLFHAGTKYLQGQWWTSGGRVLNVVSIGKSQKEARQKCYQWIQRLKSLPLKWRQDIAALRS
ncbi:MAG: phosphoribosylamine--glycine ligase [Planctomycetota bacterium]|nr:MAG: phosphoribosylamine--glycine ligase [Planctomycetota bacterium]